VIADRAPGIQKESGRAVFVFGQKKLIVRMPKYDIFILLETKQS
jgi:hypothetical protein